MNNLAECLKGVRTVAIAGHVNPDGDCIGSCMGVYLYLRDNFPDIRADVYMEKPREVFYYIEDLDQVRTEYDGSVSYDLLILLDISSKDRIGRGRSLRGDGESSALSGSSCDQQGALYLVPQCSHSQFRQRSGV